MSKSVNSAVEERLIVIRYCDVDLLTSIFSFQNNFALLS